MGYIVTIVDGMRWFLCDEIVIDGANCLIFSYEWRSAKRFGKFRDALHARNLLAGLGLYAPDRTGRTGRTGGR